MSWMAVLVLNGWCCCLRPLGLGPPGWRFAAPSHPMHFRSSYLRRFVLLMDPVLGTGRSASRAIQVGMQPP